MTARLGRIAAMLALVLAAEPLRLAAEPLPSAARPLPAADAALSANLQKALDTARADGGEPSIAAVLFDRGGVIWAGASGTSDAARTTPASADSCYRAGSISKLVTAMLVMQDVEAGRVDLDAPVARYLPAFAPQNGFGVPVTVRHLLTHRAGLVREPPVGSYFDAGDPGLEALVASLGTTRLVTAPGSAYRYSNAGIAVLSALVARLAGKSFDMVAKERFLAPAGMTSSSFRVAGCRLAHAETVPFGGPRVFSPVFDLGLAGAGGLATTPADLARLGTALLRNGGGLVRPETLERMWQPATGVGGKGLGFNIADFAGQRRIGHGGAIYGYTADLALLPQAGIGVAVMATIDGSPVPFRLSDHMLAAALAIAAGTPLPAVPTPLQPLSPALRDRLEGYFRGPGGEVVVRTIADKSLLEGPRVAAEIRARDGAPVLAADIGFEAPSRIDPAGGWIDLDGRRYTRSERPRPTGATPALKRLIGFYRHGSNELVLYERGGVPWINIEWSSYEAMTFDGPDTLRFADDSQLYPRERLDLVRGGDGDVVAVSLGGIRFDRAAGDAVADRSKAAANAQRVADARRLALAATPPAPPPGLLKPDLVDLRTDATRLRFDIRYAGVDNFLGTPVYRKPIAFLQRPAAAALDRAAARLATDGLGITVHDSYRPWYVTRIFWDLTPADEKIFVADPAEGSRHNRGAAVDIGIHDLGTGAAVASTGDYDETSPRSYAAFVGGTALQRWRRDRLRAAMQAEGFDVYPFEWWHFDFRGWDRYPVLNIEVDR